MKMSAWNICNAKDFFIIIQSLKPARWKIFSVQMETVFLQDSGVMEIMIVQMAQMR